MRIDTNLNLSEFINLNSFYPAGTWSLVNGKLLNRLSLSFRYMYEVMQILRQQYHGCLPLISVEKYLNDLIDLARKTQAVDEKLNEIEDLRSNLMIKQSALDDIIDRSKAKCIDEEDCCPHKIKLLVLVRTKFPNFRFIFILRKV